MEELDGIELDSGRWPQELQQLLPVLRQWSTSDDIARERRLEAASDQQLRELYEAVQPHFQAINQYLDETDNEENATPLGSVAEAAMEAAFAYEERTGESLLR